MYHSDMRHSHRRELAVNIGTLREEKVHVEIEWDSAKKTLRWPPGLGSLSTIFLKSVEQVGFSAWVIGMFIWINS